MEYPHYPGGISSFSTGGVEIIDSNIRRVRNGDRMFGVRSPRAIICAALAFLLTLTFSGHYLSGPRYQQDLAENMASTLKFLTVPPKGSHTATVIFMHVRRHCVISTSFLFRYLLLRRDWVTLATVGSRSLNSSRSIQACSTLGGFSLTRNESNPIQQFSIC